MRRALTNDLFITTSYGLRRIEFNRPDVLNALNIDMIRALTPLLHKLETNPTCQAIVFRGVGNAFCAGGDIRSLYEYAQKDDTRSLAFDFFREEYRLNYLLSQMETPLISILNGITMGGGVGLSMHGKFVIATEKSVFAMPETSIGFFPDVGASHFLSRMGQQFESVFTQNGPKAGQGLGTYLGLTGERVEGKDLTGLGLAAACIKTSHMNRLEDLVSSLNMTDEIDIQERDHMVWTALQDMYVTPNENDLNPEFFEITEAIFGAEQEEDNVEGILKRLLHHGNEWALETHAKLMKMCPLSLKVTHELIRRGADRPVKECLEMEYRVACRMMSNPDFTEGVKHMIIDKTRTPTWQDTDISSVSPDRVEKFFTPFEDESEELMLYPLEKKIHVKKKSIALDNW